MKDSQQCLVDRVLELYPVFKGSASRKDFEFWHAQATVSFAAI
jgi:hypothetical protein